MKVAIGIDIGGTNTVIGAVSVDGEIIERTSIPTPDDGDINKYIGDIGNEVRKLVASVKGAEVNGVGIGAPNANYYTGMIEYAPNLSFKGMVPLAEMLTNELGYDVVKITNDANAAALGEKIYGGAKGETEFAMITLGTGLGSGLVTHGELVYGHDGFAGEVGHITVRHGGRLCGCGARGHFETYCSATGMVRTALEIISETNDMNSPLASVAPKDLTSKQIYDAAIAGDKTAVEVFKRTGEILGQGLADVVAFSSPRKIFLFGGPVAAGDILLDPTKESFERHLLPFFKGKISIEPSKLPLGDTAILGASALVWQEIQK